MLKLFQNLKKLLRFSKVTKSMEENNIPATRKRKEILNKALWLTEGIRNVKLFRFKGQYVGYPE